MLCPVDVKLCAMPEPTARESAQGGAQGQPGHTPLKRVIGPKLLFFFVLGDIVGAGIYALTGSVAEKIGGALWVPFFVAFAVMSSGITSAASAAVAFSETCLREFVTLPTWAVGITFIVLLALINFRGVGESLKANLVLTCIELSGLLIVITVGVIAISSGKGEPSRLIEINATESSMLLAITSATALAFFAWSASRTR